MSRRAQKALELASSGEALAICYAAQPVSIFLRTALSARRSSRWKHEVPVAGSDQLSGLRILIVEDEYLVAFELEEAVVAMGATVTTVGTRAEALDALANGRPDGAILDVQLGLEMSYEVAERLIALAIPFFFTTGFDRAILPPRWRDCPRLSKPFAPTNLERLAIRVFRGSI